MPKTGPVSLLGLGEEEDEYTMTQTQRSRTHTLPAACPLHSQHFIAENNEYQTRKLHQKDASREVSFSHPAPAGKDVGQYFLSGKGQA